MSGRGLTTLRYHRPLISTRSPSRLRLRLRRGKPSSGKRAELLLDKMEDMEKEGSLPFPIDSPKYSTVMKAYAIHGDHKNTEAIFERCRAAYNEGNESARPNAFTWNILMDSYAKSNTPDAWKIIENLVSEMQSQHEKGILKEPYNRILKRQT